ncbi:ParB N-terminal domain-containing protein [Mycobacterium sp. Y57]|uniref:ParB N-terminal domain-containing protein n=1 Tax=Mycolicibacterium xanthum TaxID=2796469 RepID=UPI001C85FD57|nr:ParB N-terminal domain-containing protein [Mycolicibacterium xanthum]MBX7434573.1 ParB N-terminal domain-containing protein [Mycolicibacterium xanthum]
MSDHFQPMPELPAEQYEALRNDIMDKGVQMPVIKDQYGRIVDGNHRAAIAAELGINYPVVVITVDDDDDAMDRAVALNCSRRHLTREQVRDIIGHEIRRRTRDSDRAIARRVGCSPSTVGAVRAALCQAEAEIAAEAKRREEERAEEIRAEKRRQLEELEKQVVTEINDLQGRIAMTALMQHREGANWQTVGDVLERMTWHQLREADHWLADRELFGRLLGTGFDEIRSWQCDADCAVCDDRHRQWRDAHPERVYRWADPEVSNLDTSTADPQAVV